MFLRMHKIQIGQFAAPESARARIPEVLNSHCEGCSAEFAGDQRL